MVKREQKTKKNTLKWILGVSGVLILSLGTYSFSAYSSANDNYDKMHEPLERDASEKNAPGQKVAMKEPFSVLLAIDVDEAATGQKESDPSEEESDTVIVMTVNPEDKSTKMVTIPRDTYTEMIGDGKVDTEMSGAGTMDKVSNAYSLGGNEMAMATVENLLDVPLDYVIQINLEGFEDIVNALDSITVNNKVAFGDYAAGKIKLSSDEVMDYVRSHEEDPQGDAGRLDRQKQVTQAIMKDGVSVNGVLNHKGIFDAVGDNVRTNMTFDEMKKVQSQYRNSASTVEQLKVEDGSEQTINGVQYYMMDETELEEIQTTLKEHLDL